MATWDFVKVDEFVVRLKHLEKNTDEIIGRALYEGAKVVADGIKDALVRLPADDSPYGKHWRTSINSVQKKGLIDGFGIAPEQKRDGFINVKLGFDGYNEMHTKDRPNGQPNPMIARSLESGTSFMPKNPIISQTTKSLKKECERTMQEVLDEEMEKEI